MDVVELLIGDPAEAIRSLRSRYDAGEIDWPTLVGAVTRVAVMVTPEMAGGSSD